MSQQMKRDYRLHDSLTRGLSKEKKELIEDGFKSSRSFLDALVNKLEKEIEKSIKNTESQLSYMDKGWELHQAHCYGYREALREFINYFVDSKTKDIK